MARAVFSAPGDAKAVLTALRNLAARLGEITGGSRKAVVGTGTTEARIAALEAAVNRLYDRITAVTKG